jgi:hypothetical protein
MEPTLTGGDKTLTWIGFGQRQVLPALADRHYGGDSARRGQGLEVGAERGGGRREWGRTLLRNRPSHKRPDPDRPQQ